MAVLAPVCRTWTVKVTRSPRLWVTGLAVLAISRTGSTTVIGTPWMTRRPGIAVEIHLLGAHPVAHIEF